jgi:hypothetical protein
MIEENRRAQMEAMLLTKRSCRLLCQPSDRTPTVLLDQQQTIIATGS